MLFWILAVVPLILLYLYLKRINQYWEIRKVPHVKPWLLLGNMGSMFFRRKGIAELMQDFYHAFDDDTRYIGITSFLTPTLLIKDVNLIKQVCIKEFDHFMNHRSFVTEEMDPLFGKNLVSLHGDKWRSMRSTLSPAFTGSKMRAMFVLMSECAEQFTNYFTGVVDPNEPMTLELKDTFTRYANDVIASTAFGIKCDSMKEKDNEFYLMGKDVTNFGGLRAIKFLFYIMFPGFMKRMKTSMFSEQTTRFFRSLIKSNIKSREEQGIIRPDMIHLLMEARKGKLKYVETKVKDEDAGFATVEESDVGKQQVKQEILSDDDITAQALIFFLAGFDTISTALCYTVYELALNEDIQEKLQNEIDKALENCNGKITYDVVVQLNYLDMAISEGLRKWPPAPVTDRVCLDSFTIQPEKPDEIPVVLNADDPISLPIYAIQRDPKYYPNPEKFDPERFSDENKANIIPFSYMPFGVGPRNCIGSRFALLEAKTLLFYMLSKFSFVVVEKTEIPIQVTKSQFSMNAANGFWLGLKVRNK